MARREERRAEMERWFALRVREGLTLRQLSRRSGIPFGTLTSWSRKLEEDGDHAPAFVELRVAEDPAGSPEAVTIRFAAGHEMHLQGPIDAEVLARLAGLLVARC